MILTSEVLQPSRDSHANWCIKELRVLLGIIWARLEDLCLPREWILF
jgi:hypothetical protein